MRHFLRTLLLPLTLPARGYFWGGFVMVVFTAWVMSTQISDRFGFANGDLRHDVMERWGAPIVQAAPSVRYVESGSVFNSLRALPFDSQRVVVESAMSYRKRGLVYFSGFEFQFNADYYVSNPKAHAIDAVFVFPLQPHSNRILLSDLEFAVDGEPASLPIDAEGNKLVWTGRLEAGDQRSFAIRFKGQGLDRFTYLMDPAMAVRQFQMSIDIHGGDNYDYEYGIVPAHNVSMTDDVMRLEWQFDSLESGVPVGVSLPSQTSFDSIISTMATRSWATFALFFAGLVILSKFRTHTLERHEAYLSGAIYAFFFVLLAYLSAYMNFYVAYTVSCAAIGALLVGFLSRVLGATARLYAGALVVATLILPTLAVVFEQHTGLIYSLQILAALTLAARLFTDDRFRVLFLLSRGELPGELTHADD